MRRTSSLGLFVVSAVFAAIAPASLRIAAQDVTPPGASASGSPSTDAPLVDATLESMRSGANVTLSSHRGRQAVVVFYEDRPHLDDNEALKGELQRFIADNHLESRLVVYGIGNLGDVGGVPRAIVRQMARPLLERYTVDILLDWEGVLRRAPFSLATNASNVAVIDRSGRLIWRATGTLDATQRRGLYGAIRGAIR